MAAVAWPVERYADYFVNYLFDDYQGSRHVRRVATWIGFILMAIERAGGEISLNRTRQLFFAFNNRKFKVKYNHQIGTRGGIEIVEVLPEQGSPEGHTFARITSLEDAENLYREFRERLDTFMGQ